MKARFLALAALVLGLASCQQEFNGAAQLGGEVDFQLKVDAAELATRAAANGANDQNNAYDSAFGAIDYLQAGNGVDDYRVDWKEVDLRYSLEVYDAGVNYDNTDVKPVKDRMVKIVDAYEQVVFDLRLVPGRDYRFVVFADFVRDGEYDKDIDPSIEYQEDLGLRHFIGDDLRDITIIERDNNNAVANQINDEIGDAYFYTDVVEDLQTNSSHDVTLKRPYGKLRVIATDLAELNLNVEPKSVKVQYESSRPVGFNAVTGRVTSELSETTYFSVYNDGVCKLIDDNTNGLANHFYNAGYDSGSDAYSTVNADGVKRHTHMTLFTDYILATNEQTPVHFTMSVYDDKDGQSLIKETIFNTTIPIERNHLTTIVGNVLTSATEITVTIDDNFANADNTTDAPFYQQTISNEAELLAAIEANSGEYILVSDIKVDGIPASTLAATRSTGNGTTINLNDKIITLKTNITIAEGNTLTITDNGQIIKDGGQIVNNGTLNIEGGNFGKETIENNGSANVSGGNFADDAIVNNGSVSVEGDNSGQEDRIIVNGTDAVVSNIVYTVEELQDALDEGKVDEIIFGADLVGDATISQRDGVNVYINGADKMFDGTIYIHGNARSNGAETLKIANINFKTKSAKYFIYANYRTEPERYAHNVTIENCTFTSLAGDNSVEVCGASFRQAFNVTIKDCTATNTFYLAWFTGSVGTTIDGCKAINNYEGITVGNGTTSVVKDTEISSSTYGLRVESNHSNYSDTHNVTIENCKLNAFIPVSVRNLTSGKFNLKLNGSNVLTRGGLYDIALCSNEYKEGAVAKAPTCEWTISGADNFIVFPREYAVKSVEQIAEALTLKSKVLFADNIEGNVYIAQQENFNVVIDGRGYQFDGGFIVDGKNRNEGAETLTLKNINFYTESTDKKTFISCPSTYNGENERYSHNVTIDNCTFRASSLTENVGAISAQKTYHLAVKDCEAYNIHSLLQVQSCDNDVKVENVKVENCFSGISVGNTKTTTISGANIKTQKYGIRLDGETSRKVTVNVANSNIEAYIPIVARKVTTGCNVEVNLSGTTLVEKNNDMFDVVFQDNKDYEDGNVTPVTPTGNWKITGADDYIVYPRNYASNNDELKAAIAAGTERVILADGDYAMTEVGDLRGKTLTIVGTKDVVIDATKVDTRNQFVTGTTLAFEGVTINFGKDLYMGFANTASLKYKNCDINGLQFLFGENVEFENCTFNSNDAEHSVWTYGVKNVSFTECDFTYGDRCVNCYSENGVKQTVNFTKCTFTTANTASEGAVEINSCYFSVGIEVNMDGCTAPAYGQMAYVSPWDSTNGEKTTINIK